MNTYIGARYVPIFGRKDESSIQWDNTKPYEPLTIVLYQGNSYTSRQAVPIGIDILNEEFWALTGNYNAQVEQYRTEVRTFEGRLDAAEDAISAETTARESADENLDNKIDTEVDNIEQAIQGLSGNLATETTNRENADTTLHNEIANEIQARTAADGVLQGNIDNLDEELDTISANLASEIQNRIAGDLSLQNQITVLAAKQKLVLAEDYGAVGDGVTDCTQAIQQAIDENPCSTIYFKGGVYIISDTIRLNGDVDPVSLDLNGATIKWNGADSSSWTEGNGYTYLNNSRRIFETPNVMFGVYRHRDTPLVAAGRTVIQNGTIDGNHKAGVCIQNLAFVSVFTNLRIQNFQYVGIYNGTDDGNYYNLSNERAGSGISAQTTISDCYFVRGSDMSARPNVSCIFVTFSDNQIDNCITNRTSIGITLRTGGNSVSNTHLTTQYLESERPAASSYGGAGIRLWPFNAGTTQINLFDNIYFNAMKRAFYTYRDSSQSFTGANLRTLCSNSHFTFYATTSYFEGSRINLEWYGGMWYGIIQTIDCAILTGDNTITRLHAFPQQPSIGIMRACETKIANILPPHGNSTMYSGENLVTGEWIPMCNSGAPVPAEEYKQVAIVLGYATYQSKVPGSFDIEFANENGMYYKKFIVYPTASGYSVHQSESYGSTTVRAFIENSNRTISYNGMEMPYFRVYITASANISDLRFIRITPSSPYVEVYGFGTPTNFASGNTNVNIFESAPANLIELTSS